MQNFQLPPLFQRQLADHLDVEKLGATNVVRFPQEGDGQSAARASGCTAAAAGTAQDAAGLPAGSCIVSARCVRSK